MVGNVLSGVVQGGANLVNGVQDAAIGVANLPAVVYNNTAGNLGGGQIGYIPSPDWSLDLIVENDPLHGTSKFLGGTGVVMLATIGVGSLAGGGASQAGATGAVAIATEAEAVTAFGGPAAFGRLIGIGSGLQAALERAAVITVEELQAANVTLPVARYWLGFYQNAVGNGLGGASAPARVELFQRIIVLLGG